MKNQLNKAKFYSDSLFSDKNDREILEKLGEDIDLKHQNQNKILNDYTSCLLMQAISIEELLNMDESQNID